MTLTFVPDPVPDRPPHSVHAVSRLRALRLAASSKPYVARGAGQVRCTACRLPAGHCICAWRPAVACGAGVCLIMGDIEALKPTNTGWLIADVVPHTWAFGWSRTAVDPGLIALLNDPQWQPYVVFPAEYAEAQARVVTEVPQPVAGVSGGARPRPLFVLLDGTWSEARKMFRKSPYLDRLPVLSLQPDRVSNYRLRRSTQGHHFCTAEVGALCLALAGETGTSDALWDWFDIFSAHYLGVRHQVQPDRLSEAHLRLEQWKA